MSAVTPPRSAPKRAKPPEPEPEGRSLPSIPKAGLAALIPVGLIALLLVAWGVDSAMNSGNVGRNVSVAGVDVSGLSEAELESQLREAAASYEDTLVVIRTDDSEVRTTAGVVGLELDPAATAEEAMAVGRGAWPTRPFSWLGGIFGSRTAEAAVRLGDGDPAELARLVNAGQPEPVEPQVVASNGEITVVPGEAVQRFDLSTVRDDVFAAARSGASPIEVEAAAVEIAPNRSDAQAQAWADQFNDLTADGIRVGAGNEVVSITPDQLRSWAVVDNSGTEPTLAFDPDLAIPDLERAFGTVTSGAEEPTVVVEDGELAIEGFSAMACCGADAPERILEGLYAGDSTVRLELIDISGREQEVLAELGIVELIGEATTPYDCCQSRVTNIQLFADYMTGVVLQPGESISLNEHVGQRTTEKGFVESGVIYAGRLQTDVGGGISQFATTIFQAMFYGGLDIDSYFPHTIWFSRYADFEGRRGIESTISFPQPDVAFTNNTPYPVLIWPSYTDTSLTVSLYSTKYVEADVKSQDIYGSGQCTIIDTERVRTYPDGTEEIDNFRARYQPGDNIGCDGKPTDPTTVTPEPEKKKKKKDAEAEDDTDAEETPAEEDPAEEAPTEETPVEEAPTEETPVEETPVEETPVDDPPAEGEDAGI